MPFFLRNIHIDSLSFWLGFLAATLFWWITRNLRGYWPVLLRYVKDRLELIRQQNLSGLEERLRRDTVRRAQAMHLAWSLFALDEILIEPRLLAPPAHIEPGGIQPPDEILSNILAYLPDWTEFPSRLGAATLSLTECLEGGSNLAIIGRPGSGKTVALANLACQIARREVTMPDREKVFPIHFHIADLNLPDPNSPDPLTAIIDIYTKTSPVMLLTQIPEFIRNTVKAGQAVMIMDGLDELPPLNFSSAVDYIRILMKAYPGLHWVVGASDDNLSGLTGLGFIPVPIAAWTQEHYASYVARWSSLWMEHIFPDGKHADAEQVVNPLLLNNWLLSENIHRTPFEFTLKVWSAYVGDARGSKPTDALEAYLHRMAPKPKARLALERLALQMVSTSQIVINRHKAGSLVAEFELASVPMNADEPGMNLEPELVAETAAAAAASNLPGTPGNPTEAPKVASIQRILPDIIDNGLVVERMTETLGFVHPLFLGYLAGCALQQGGNPIALVAQPTWIAKDLALRYLAAAGNVSSLVGGYLDNLEEPLYRNLFTVALWLKDAPPNQSWRGVVMRKLAELIQRDLLPLSVRQRAIAGLVSSNDPGVGLLFHQMLTSPSAPQRVLAVLGCGVMPDLKIVPELCELLKDSEPDVRYATALALACLGAPAAIDALVFVLKQGEEDLRRAAAEALARNPVLGYTILKDAALSQDILVRRAAVFGLIQVNETWANELLEKMRVEDGQWVVRSAAAQAIEVAKSANPRIPRPIPIPSQSPWLITYAGKQGVGIPPGSQATDLILSALKNGTDEEKLAALDYLKYQTDEGIIGAILMAAYTEVDAIREAAANALWWMAVSGINIPSPKKLGLT